MFELTDVKEVGCYEGRVAEWEYDWYPCARWVEGYREYPRYRCKCADGELISSIDRQNICLEFTKKYLTLWFNLETYVITGTARDCVSLSLSLSVKTQNSAKLYTSVTLDEYVDSRKRTYTDEFLKKLSLGYLSEKIFAFNDSLQAKIREKKYEEARLEREKQKLEEEQKEKERQLKLEERKKEEDEIMNMLDNL